MKNTATLSPAAQVVMDAYWATPKEPITTQIHRAAVAAALRAAADQTVPEQRKPPFADTWDESAWATAQDLRRDLLAIAADLEHSA